MVWLVIVLIIVLILLCNKKESFTVYRDIPITQENFSVLNGDFQLLLDKETKGILYEKDTKKINIKDVELGDSEIDKILNKYNEIDEKIFNIPYVKNLYTFDRFVPSHKNKV